MCVCVCVCVCARTLVLADGTVVILRERNRNSFLQRGPSKGTFFFSFSVYIGSRQATSCKDVPLTAEPQETPGHAAHVGLLDPLLRVADLTQGISEPRS